MGEAKLDPFLRRVIEQRERDQYIDVLGEADAAREKLLDQQIRLKCSTPGCEVRPNEATAARSDKCARCQKRARARGGLAATKHLAVCEIEGCGKELRVNNLTGLCQEHRQKVPSRKRAGLVPDFARSAGTAGDLLQQAQQPQSATPAEPPAKEKQHMAQGKPFVATDDAVRAAFTEAGGSINKTMEKLGTTSWSAVKKRCDALGLTKKAKAAAPKLRDLRGAPSIGARGTSPRKPRTVAAVAQKHITPGGDPVQLLEAQLAAIHAQAARIEKALEVLREE